jgi:hypothetical protein
MDSYWSDCFSRSVINGILSAIFAEIIEVRLYALGKVYVLLILLIMFLSNFIIMKPKYKDTLYFTTSIYTISYICAKIVLVNLLILYGYEGSAITAVTIGCYICNSCARLCYYAVAKKEIEKPATYNYNYYWLGKNMYLSVALGLIFRLFASKVGMSDTLQEVTAVVAGIVVATIALKKTKKPFDKIMWYVFSVMLFYATAWYMT